MQINKETDNEERNIKIQETIKENYIFKNKPIYIIPIEKLRKELRNKIIKNDEIKDFYLTEDEKRIKVLEQDKKLIYKNSSFSDKRKNIIVLNEEYTSIDYEKDKTENYEKNYENHAKNKKSIFPININEIMNEVNSLEIQTYIKIDNKKINNNESEDNRNEQKDKSVSLDDSSLHKIDSSNNHNKDSESLENKFNTVRMNFYLKYNLYDTTLNLPIQENPSIPKKYKINEEKYAFLYPNEKIISYCITKTGYLNNEFNSTNEYDNDIQFDKNLGLYFCGKVIEIKTEKGSIEEKCAPNQFICKQCMEKSKKRYKIKNNYLINIYGRVATKNKGSYHCFGHFSCGNQIEDCIKKFSCKACKLIDLYSKYYF